MFRVHFIGPVQHDRIIILEFNALTVGPVSQCAILLEAKDVHVRDAVAAAFDVSVEHRGVGVQAELVGGAVHVEPGAGPDLALEGFIVDAIVKHLRPAPRKRSQPRLNQIAQHGLDAFIFLWAALGDPGQVHDLYRCEGFDVQLRGGLADRLEHAGVIVQRQPGVQPPDDVNLGGSRLRRLGRFLADLFDRVLVRAALILLAVERAERARQRTDVGVVDVAVDVVVRHITVHAPADLVSQRADGPEIGGFVQHHAVLDGQPLPAPDLPHNRREASVQTWCGLGPPVGHDGAGECGAGHRQGSPS